MKIKETLSGEEIVKLCCHPEENKSFYCNKKYCSIYNDCKNKKINYIYCEVAISNYLDSEETEAKYLLRRLEEEKDKSITFETVNNLTVLDKIEFINRLIDYIKKKESAEN